MDQPYCCRECLIHTDSIMDRKHIGPKGFFGGYFNYPEILKRSLIQPILIYQKGLFIQSRTAGFQVETAVDLNGNGLVTKGSFPSTMGE